MTIKDAPAFDFYPERWLVGVAHMSDAEQLAYLRLLCHQWLAGDAGLPGDLPALKRLAVRGVTEAVLAKLPVCEDGRRRNARLEVVRAEQRERIAKKSEQRKAAALRRWHPDACGKDATASPPHMRDLCGSNAHHPPPTTHPKDKESPAALSPVLPFASAEFADAWSRWTKHRSEIRKPLKPTMEAAQLNELKAMGEARAIAALNHTIAKGWQGIREPDNVLPFHGTHRQAPPHRSDSANAPGRYS